MWNDVIQAITSVGFPIVACGAMGWFVYDTTNKNRKEMSDLISHHRDEVSVLNGQHKEEMLSVTEAVNNNTLALEKLCTLMENKGV